jgi:hypothetical protein
MSYTNKESHQASRFQVCYKFNCQLNVELTAGEGTENG